MTAVDRDRYSVVTQHPRALMWLTIQSDLGRARNTTQAYGRALDVYLASCQERGVQAETATRADIARYVC